MVRQTINAIYENGVFRPLDRLQDLRNGMSVRLQVDDLSADADPELSGQSQEVLQLLSEFSQQVEAEGCEKVFDSIAANRLQLRNGSPQ